MKIQVTERSVYGNTLVYPVCEKAKTFAAMLGKKTLTPADLNHIKALGFSIEPVFQSTVALAA